ncbi:hypothetical protein F5X97DRAFT_326035 [Nemania serpens]|nr:hypothetical protein F5X97DRAFT_326035 [Nemania serpens]
MAATRTPLPTKRRALSDDENQNQVNRVTSPVAQRTALPTARPVPVNDDTVEQENHSTLSGLSRRALLARERSARKSRQGGFDEVDPNERPALIGARGVVLKNGRYRCNICRNLMGNQKRQISAHNSKLHPRDPTKGSAYLRQLAKRPSPCEKCGKICSSLEMLKQHVRHYHKEARALNLVTPSVDGRSSDSDH